MTFYEVLEQVLALLQLHKRVSYRALKLQFHLLGDESLEALKDELIYQRVARDEDGQGLVWTGETFPTFAPTAPVTALHATSDTAAITSSVEHGQLASLPPTTIPSDMQGAKPEPTRSAPEAERRQLTVMFCDLTDSTKLSQQLDPEDLREVIRAYQQTSAEVIHHFDGYIAQHLGDGLLIYFGWPVAHEDDAQRALHAGLGIVEAITTTLNPRLDVEKGVQLTVRLGIHTGPVVVGEMGGGGRHEHLATGETVNIAARLEALAPPNTVVISPTTERLVHGAFVLEDLGPQMLKGVAEPMPVFRVHGLMQDHEDETGAVAVPFLVGRDEEVGLLLRRWEQSKERLGQVVLVSGEAGIGKSRLVEVLRAHVRQEGLPRIAFRCSPYYKHSALYPVMTHVERLLHFDRDDAPATKLDKLEQGLQSYSLPLAEVVPLFATLLSVPLDHRYPTPTLTPQRQKQQTLDALVAWMLEEAERQPVLAVWEDLHWADSSTLEMLGLVLEQTPTMPMLHVLTFRPEFELPWPTRSHMTPIALNRLERPQVEALITHLAVGKTLPTEVVEHIVTKTDGVPLYVEELTKMLLGSDLLHEEADRYALTGPLLAVAIPETLQDSLMARLDQLNTGKEVVQLGAVIGREFAYELLQAVSLQDEATLQAALAPLVEAELLYQRGRPPRAKYIFKHALIQDAAYASLLKSARQHQHQRIAQTLEARFPETRNAQPELLAHHYTEAGLGEQAVAYWHRAGQQAIEHSANVEAVAQLSKGLDVLTTLPDDAERTQYELCMQLTLGPALMALKSYGAPEVGETYSRALELCKITGDTQQYFQALWGLWRFNVVGQEVTRAHPLADELLALAQQTDDSAHLIEAHNARGITLFYLGEFSRALAHFEAAMALYDPQGHPSLAFLYGQDPGVICHAFAALTLWMLGYPAKAIHRSQEALTLAQDPFSLAYSLFWTSLPLQFCRQSHIVQERAETAITLSKEQGFVAWLAGGMILQGWARVQHGTVDEGLAQLKSWIGTWPTVGKRPRPYLLSLLGEAYMANGQIQEALDVLAEALSEVEKYGECWWEAELYRLQGELLLAQPPRQETEAETCFLRAIDIASHQGAKSLELRAAVSLCRLWQTREWHEQVRELLASRYEWFKEGLETVDLIEAQALLDALP